MKNQSITLFLPKDLLDKVRLLALQRHMSVSDLLEHTLAEMVADEESYASTKARHIARIRDAMDLGSQGTIGCKRDELHVR